MSLNVEIDRYDYADACKAVQKILDKIKADPISEDEAKLEEMPSPVEIVDAVWDAIK